MPRVVRMTSAAHEVVTVADGVLDLAVARTTAASGEARLDAFDVRTLAPGGVISRDAFEP